MRDEPRKLECVFEKPRVKWQSIVGVWTLIGLFYGFQLYSASSVSGSPMPLWKAIAWQLLASYLWMLTTPAVHWVARRFSFERHNWPRHLKVQLLVCLVYGLTLGAAHVCLNYQMVPPVPGPSAARFLSDLVSLLDRELFVYWAIVFVSHAFNYYNRYWGGELRSSQLQTQLVQAKLQSLKSQLHPHFLFNTLNTISMLMREDVEVADRMVVSLGEFLRNTLKESEDQEIPLARELEALNHYFEIEQARFQNKLQVYLEVEPEALDACVPSLILQPLVENAIKHGISPYSVDGLIVIRARCDRGMLRVQVCDNGPGIKPERRKHSHGVGLSNTRARLEHLYGPRQKIELRHVSGDGFMVDLTFPFKKYSLEVRDGGNTYVGC